MIDFLMSCNLSAAHRIQWEWYPRLPADKAHGLQIGSGRAVCVAIFLYGHAIFILHVFRREHPYIFDPPNACCGYPCNYLTHLIRFCTMTNVVWGWRILACAYCTAPNCRGRHVSRTLQAEACAHCFDSLPKLSCDLDFHSDYLALLLSVDSLAILSNWARKHQGVRRWRTSKFEGSWPGVFRASDSCLQC